MTPRRTSFQVARVFGVSVRVGISWFFVLFLFIIIGEPQANELLRRSHTIAYAITVLSVLAFFGSVILHELGHALAARRNGQQVASIELWMLGGITRTVGATRSPGAQFSVAAAGPLVTLIVIGIAALGGALGAPHQQFFDLTIAGSTRTTPVGVWLKALFYMNLFVLAVNLIPAFPLDGGQIIQALAWKVTGDRNKATRTTGRVGQALAVAIGVFALYLLSKNESIEGVWLLLIAMFVYQGAGAAVAQGTMGQRLQTLTVADVMDREPITVPAETTLLDAQEHYFARYQWPWFAVVDPSRHFLGLITRQRIDAELAAGRPALTASEALEEGLPVEIGETQPLESLLSHEALGRLGGMVAVDGEGTLQGVVTLAQVRQALRPVA